MSETTQNSFDRSFEPDSKDLNGLFALLIGEEKGAAGLDDQENGDADSVEWGWLVEHVPGARRIYGRLIDAGYVIETYWHSFDCTVMTLSPDADIWLSKRYGLPLFVLGEDHDQYRQQRSEWIIANVVAELRMPSEKRVVARAKPIARTTSDLVTQISYTVPEAKKAIAKINGLYAAGILRERSAAGYKATITRRIG